MTQEIWRPVRGFPHYEASNLGRVRSLHTRSKHILRTYADYENGRLSSITANAVEDGKHYKLTINRFVYLAFCGPIPAGFIVYNRDGIMENSRPENLALTTPDGERFRDRARQHGGSKRQPVLKIDTNLEPVEAYRSAKKAALAVGVHPSTMVRWCNLGTKSSVMAPDGYIYAWDDENWLRKTLERAVPELEAKGYRFTPPATSEYWNDLYDQEDPPDADDWETAPALQ